MIRVLALSFILLGVLASGCAPSVLQQEFPNGAVAADHPLASQAGADMLRRGGNAVDAAVAASFCLSVVDPFSCGIGGGGFMVVWDPASSRAHALNYRERAPSAMRPDSYMSMDDPLASRYGAMAVGVPGTVAGLLEALDRWGTLDRAVVLEPAIRHARDGFQVNAAYLNAVGWVRKQRTDHPRLQSISQWVWEHLCGSGAMRIGDVLRQPEQARALQLIARDGVDAFYGGPIGDSIASTIEAHGGIMTAADVADYRTRVQMPLTVRGILDDCTMLSMPPPSSGGIAMQQMLRFIDAHLSKIRPLTPDNPDYVHLVAEAMKHAFADRATHLADGEQVPVPVDRLLDAGYLSERADTFDMDRTLDSLQYGSVAPPPADSGTSHVSVVDADGMAVACTETINLSFGSLLADPTWGIVLNDELDDFTADPDRPNAFGLRQSRGNLPGPRKRPLSSMSPTIVLQNGQVRLVAGASGGPRIITGTFQVILNCLLFDMTPQEAVERSRFHHQWLPDTLQFESSWTDGDIVDLMEARGHATDSRSSVGVVQVIEVLPDGRKRPASDPRKGGLPDGH